MAGSGEYRPGPMMGRYVCVHGVWYEASGSEPVCIIGSVQCKSYRVCRGGCGSELASGTPVLQYSGTPVLQYSSTPL
eukprot:3844989-Rhodomonas_salina.3